MRLLRTIVVRLTFNILLWFQDMHSLTELSFISTLLLISCKLIIQLSTNSNHSIVKTLTRLQMEKLNADLEEQVSNNAQLLAENSQKQVELKMREDDIENQKQEVIRVNKVCPSTLKLPCMSRKFFFFFLQ